MNDKIAVITGGGGVLCSALATMLAAKDYRVAVLDLKQDAADRVVDQIHENGGQALALAVDVLDKDSLEEGREKLFNHWGKGCDLLINGAGGNHPKGTTSAEYLLKEHLEDDSVTSFFDLDREGIEFVFNLNFLGTLLPCQVFSRAMIDQPGASIINLSSMNAFTPLTKIPAYSGAKAAVSNFTRWLAVHFSKVGIRVNALAPGFFLTEQNKELLTNPDGSLTARGNQIIDHTPLGRFGEARDLNSTVLWLCDPASSFITGVVIPIDGGFSAYSGV